MADVKSLEKAVEALDPASLADVVRQKGSHRVLRRQATNFAGGDTSVTCVVPLYRRDLAVGTLGSVVRQAGIDVETFIADL